MNFTATFYLLFMAALGADSRGYVLEFSGAGCVPCQQMAPIISKLEREGLAIRSVDFNQERELAQQYHVDRLPTFILIVDGREIERVQGARSETEIRQMLAKIPGAPRRSSSPLEIQLGSAAPLPRPEVKETSEPRPLKPGTNPKPGLGMWPFPGGKKLNLPAIEARGNNAEPSAPVASTDPMKSSARIRVITGNSLVRGSGTVIESLPGKSTLITCGHIFRNAHDSTKVEVDLFDAGVPKTFVASIVGYDLNADVGLITIPTADLFPACRLAPETDTPRKSDTVSSIGCSGGEIPTREQVRVTATNEFEGPETFSCTGVPVQGRSGGGLFNEQGQLVGVCFAADKKGQGGVYCGRAPMVALLQKYSFDHLIPANSDSLAEQAEIIPVDASAPWADNNSTLGISQPAVASQPVKPANPTAERSLPSVDEFAAGDAEVVILIKTQTPDGPQNKIILIQKPSRTFLKFVEGEVSSQDSPVSRQSERTPADQLLPTGLESFRSAHADSLHP